MAMIKIPKSDFHKIPKVWVGKEVIISKKFLAEMAVISFAAVDSWFFRNKKSSLNLDHCLEFWENYKDQVEYRRIVKKDKEGIPWKL